MPPGHGRTTELRRLAASAFERRHLRYNLAVLAGGATIAVIDGLAMWKGGAVGLGNSVPTGALVAPALGGLVTGGALAYSKRPAYMDGASGTYAAFIGVLALIVTVIVARASGGLPDDGSGFQNFGVASMALFFAVMSCFNVLVCFPVAFAVIFIVRTAMPGNINKYGWAEDDETEYVTPGPPPSSGPRMSTAQSRFDQAPVRYSKVPRRHRQDGE